MEDNFPILDPNAPDFKEQLDFHLWSTQSCSDYRNDRERPYNGQPWTDDGIRGQAEVKGLTFRDISDCLIKAMLASASSEEYLSAGEFTKCWDFTTDPPTPTEYLKANQDKYVSTKVELGTWRPQDVYKIDWTKVDPLAIAQNLSVEIEKMMGIYPNIPKVGGEQPEKSEKKPFEYANKLEWVPEIPGFVAYVLMCENGKMYKGHTGNFKQRMLQHFNGFGGATTKKMKPIYILHHDEFDSKKAAIAREAFFKSGYGFNWLKAGENLRTIKPSE